MAKKGSSNNDIIALARAKLKSENDIQAAIAAAAKKKAEELAEVAKKESSEDAIQTLSYRELQHRCKLLRLPAKGTKEVLQQRLRETETIATSTECKTVTPTASPTSGGGMASTTTTTSLKVTTTELPIVSAIKEGDGVVEAKVNETVKNKLESAKLEAERKAAGVLKQDHAAHCVQPSLLGTIPVKYVFCSVYHADRNDVVELGLGPMRLFAEEGELAVVEYPTGSKNRQALFGKADGKLLFRANLLNKLDPWRMICSNAGKQHCFFIDTVNCEEGLYRRFLFEFSDKVALRDAIKLLVYDDMALLNEFFIDDVEMNRFLATSTSLPDHKIKRGEFDMDVDIDIDEAPFTHESYKGESQAY